MRTTKLTIILATIFLFSLITANAATLTCEQVSDSSMTIAQFASDTIEVKCTASGGSVSNIQITPNKNPSSGITISSSQTISSSLSDQGSSTAKWTVTGSSPNTYSISYTINSDGTNAWDGASSTSVEVESPAQLSLEYTSEPRSVMITNIGGATATSVKLKLYRGSTEVVSKNYPSSITGGGSGSYSFSSSYFDTTATYTIKAYVGDTYHDEVSASYTLPGDEPINESDPTTPGGISGGAGGAGGGGSGEVWNFGNLTGQGIMPVNNTAYSFMEVEVNVRNIVPNAKLFLEKKSVLATTIPAVDGKVYQYMVLTSPNIEQSFNGGAVKFKVSKEWLKNNSLEQERMFLLRYNGNNWIQEPITILYQDETYVYYKSSIENLGTFAVAWLPRVELDYIKMSSLKPELIDLEMVIESGLSDALMIDRIESYLFGKMDVEKTIELSKELVKDFEIKREVNATGNKSRMTVTIKNTRYESVSFIYVEAVPKSIVYDIYELKEFDPRIYDLVIREDPVIQWSFGEADTAIVAWEIRDLKQGDTATFSYSLDAVFDINKYPAPIIVKPSLQKDMVQAADENTVVDNIDTVKKSKFSNLGILLSVIVLFAIIGIVLGIKKGAREEPQNTNQNKKEESDGIKEHSAGENNKIEKICDYINKAKKSGKSNEEIRAKLHAVGWDKDTIDKAFNHKR